jgi:hypothetical protein
VPGEMAFCSLKNSRGVIYLIFLLKTEKGGRYAVGTIIIVKPEFSLLVPARPSKNLKFLVKEKQKIM